MRKIRQTARLFIALSFLCFGFIQLAWAGDEDAFDAYYRKDYKAAFRGLSSLAEQGNAKAQGNLGAMYANGQGVAKDEDQVVKWYHKAAEQGHARAFQGVRFLAEQGNVSAQFNLADMYSNGRGIAKDDQQAVMWYRKAAEQGNVDLANKMDKHPLIRLN